MVGWLVCRELEMYMEEQSLEELRNTTENPRKNVVVPTNIWKEDWANLLTESGNVIMLNA
jgi:hypothetical protein